MTTKTLVSYCVILFFLIAAGFFTAPLFAHTNETDGSINVTIHVNNHVAVAGESTRINLTVEDSEQKFSYQHCNCSASITKEGQDPVVIPVAETFYYTFPEIGVYNMVITGSSTDQLTSSFHPFRAAFQVESIDSNGASWAMITHHLVGKHLWHVLIFGLGFLVGGYFIIRDYRKE